ncbi:MAG: hypothetical protein AABX17_03600 [Nanoarchaeota archaeon]
MSKFSKEQWIGISLILAALLIWVPLNFIPMRTTIAAVIVVAIGLYKLIF